MNKLNCTYHSTIKIKPANVEDNIYNDFDKKNSTDYPKFKVGIHVRISKHKNKIKKKRDKVNGKAMIICWIVGSVKKMLHDR